jgi:hypothetical protein
MTTQMFEKRKKQATLINQETYMEAYFNHF